MIQKPFRGIQLNRTHPLAKGLVGCWLFNEATGKTVFDLSGNGNNGTLENGVMWDCGGVSFDGNNDNVNCGSGSSLNLNGAITISARIKVNSFNDFACVIGNFWDGTNKSILLRYSSASTKWQWYWDAGATDYYIFSDTTPQTDVWIHLVGIIDENKNQYLYINGVKQIDTNAGLPVGAKIPKYIGWSGHAHISQYLNGAIKEVFIYNRGLSDKEVAWLYREPYTMFKPAINPIILYYSAGTPPVIKGTGLMILMI